MFRHFLVSCCRLPAFHRQPAFDLSALAMGKKVFLGSSHCCFVGCWLHFHDNLHQRDYCLRWRNVRTIFKQSQTSIQTLIFFRKNLEGIFLWIEKFYFPTHLRIGSWVIGMMLGYVMYPNRDSKIYINKTVERVSWILSISVMLCITLGHYPFQQIENNTTTRFSNSFYNSFARIGWSFAVSWIIYACHNGSGGIVRWFLSLKQWQPLGKMGLSIYLVHRMYQIITTMNQKQPIYWDFFTQTQKFFGDIFVSVCLGAVLYLAVENPVMLIESYLHKKINK